MGSRIRNNPSKIFECFVEIVIPEVPEQAPWVLHKYPDNFNDEEILKSVPHFCYPCDIRSSVVQVFSFVLTGADGKWTFGYCRHTPEAPTAICLISSLPWHETFYELLNKIAEITHRKEDKDLLRFLDRLYTAQVPSPGGTLILPGEDGKKTIKFTCSNHTKLPSIPENRNVSEYFNAVDAQTMMILFASLLNERRIMITSNKPSRLSACVQSANALIYPMHWQHIFIPILPTNLIDYLHAPMPFLIGVPSMVLEKASKLDFSEIVVLHADQNRIETPFDDFQSLPPEIVSSLKRRLKNSTAMLGDRMARAFLHSLVQLIGGYRDALKFQLGEKITFDQDAFIQTRTPSMQSFLQRMLQLQIFQQFIEERLEMLNSGEGFCDEFEREVNLYADKNSTKLRHQYKEWMTNMRKEGGAFIKSVKNKANPAVKHAYKSVKDRSKKAYKEVRSKIHDFQQKDSSSESISGSGRLKVRQPRSAPSSPTLLRTRPVTFHGLKPTSKRKAAKLEVLHPVAAGDESPLTPKNYNLLEVSEGSDDIPLDDSEENPSQNVSPMLNVRRISMDLMGDLQDLIFRRCSVSDACSDKSSQSMALPASDQTSCVLAPSPHTSSPSLGHGSTGEVLTPIPPPRTKRRGDPRKSFPNQSGTTPDSSSIAPPEQEDLIQLDTSDPNDELFDPLLAKDSKPSTISPQMSPRNRRSSSLPLAVQVSQGLYPNQSPLHIAQHSTVMQSPIAFNSNLVQPQPTYLPMQQPTYFSHPQSLVQPQMKFLPLTLCENTSVRPQPVQRQAMSNPFIGDMINSAELNFNVRHQASLPVEMPNSGLPIFKSVVNQPPATSNMNPWDPVAESKATHKGWETFN